VQSHQDDWDRHWADFAQANERNPAQAYRQKLVLDLLREIGGGERILDIGSGTGALAAELHRFFPRAEIVGIELSREGVERSRIAVPSATFVQRDLVRADDVDSRLQGWATAAVCSEVLEHVDDPVRLLRGAVPYLAHGCRVIVTVPGGPMSAFDHSIGHRRHFTPSTLTSLLAQSGLHVDRGRRVTHDVHGNSPTAAAAMSAFDRLFRFNLPRSPFGWQIVAVATRP
jgi:2-polyprenyl-3-methyl-5-hydroxy-6-metoxy-1,4-benzoquinol methylase